MTPNAVRLLERWTVSPGFGNQSVADAAVGLGKLLPHYPHPDDQPVEICHNGYRWFREEMEAIADAIYRDARRPGASTRSLTGSGWARKRNSSGLWAIPGMSGGVADDASPNPQHVMNPE